MPNAYQFGDWLIEPALNRASNGEVEVELEPVTMNVLAFMLEHPGETLSIDQFLSSVWNGRIVEPNAVHRNITMIRRALGDSPRDPRYVTNIRKRGYRTLAPVTPVAGGAGLADADFARVGGAAAPGDLARTAGPLGVSWTPRRTAAASVMGIITVAAAILLALTRWPEPPTGNRLAVLPFVNSSGDEGIQYLADGLSDELIHHLSRHESLQVISRRSSFYFRDSNATIPEIARQLDAAYVVDGSIRTVAGDQLEITSHLIDTRSDSSLWTKSFRRHRTDVFSLQKEIVSAMVEALRTPLGLEQASVPDHSAVHPDAYDAYLRGRHLMRQLTRGSGLRAIAELRKAVSIDPEFALAHALLADAMLAAEPEDMTWTDLLAAADEHVDEAMRLDPDLPEAYFARGRLLINMYRFDEAQTYFHKAIEMNPSLTHSYSQQIFRPMVASEEFLSATRMALNLDPLSRRAHWDYIFLLSRSGRFEEAAEQIEKYAAVDPLGARVQRAQLSAIGGNWADPLLAFLQVAGSSREDLSAGADVFLGGRLGSLGLEQEAVLVADDVYLDMSWFGDPQLAIRLARVEQARDPARFDPLVMGFILANGGEFREARPYLEEAYRRWGNRLTREDWYTSYLGEALVAVRRYEGDTTGADEVVAMMRNNVRHLRKHFPGTTGWIFSIDYQAGVAEYLAGNRAAGLRLIARASDQGFWIPPPSPFQEAMYEEPEFIEVLMKQAKRQGRERARLLEVVCQPGFASAVWQPREETCAAHRERA